MFGSVDEVDPIEAEPKPKDEKPQPKIPNGALPNCTSSPDSGHPSSRNFSVTSGLSDCSPSTEDASTQENGNKIKLLEQSAVTSEVAVDLPTHCGPEEKLKEEPAQQSSLGTGKGDLIKSPIDALPPGDEVIKPQHNEKVETSNVEEVSRTDTVKSMDSQWDSNEKSDLIGLETAESTVYKHSEKNAKPCDSKQILHSSESPMCDPPRAATKEGSVEEAINTDTCSPAYDEELTKSELSSAPHMEPLENKIQPPQPLSESKMPSDQHMDPSEKDRKSPQSPVETEVTCEPQLDPLGKETKLPEPPSETEMTTAPYLDPMGKAIHPPQPPHETEMILAPHVEPLEKETKPGQLPSELGMSVTHVMDATEKEIKPSQPLSEPEVAGTSDMEPTEKEIKPPQSFSESEMTSDSHIEPVEKEIKPPQAHSESEMTSAPDMEPTEKEPKPPQTLYESEMTCNSNMESSEKETNLAPSLSESQDLESIMNNPSNTDKPDMRTLMNWTYDSNRTKSLMKQMNEPLLENCISIMSLSKQSPDTSDDSPSALEMEEIPAALVYMPSEDILANVPVSLGPPLALTMPPEKAALGMPALELCMEAGQNTSPEATESALSEEEPEMDSLFPKPDSLAVGDHKNDVASPVSSIGTTYSVSQVDIIHGLKKEVLSCLMSVMVIGQRPDSSCVQSLFLFCSTARAARPVHPQFTPY